MKLRTVTIWTTGVVLITTTIVPCLVLLFEYLALGRGATNFNVIYAIYAFTMMWLLSGSPAAVSYATTIILKTGASSFSFLILLISTIAYACLFLYAQYMFFTDDNSCTRGFWLLTPAGAFCWMIPAWLFVLIWDFRHVPKTPPQEPQVK